MNIKEIIFLITILQVCITNQAQRNYAPGNAAIPINSTKTEQSAIKKVIAPISTFENIQNFPPLVLSGNPQRTRVHQSLTNDANIRQAPFLLPDTNKQHPITSGIDVIKNHYYEKTNEGTRLRNYHPQPIVVNKKPQQQLRNDRPGIFRNYLLDVIERIKKISSLLLAPLITNTQIKPQNDEASTIVRRRRPRHILTANVQTKSKKQPSYSSARGRRLAVIGAPNNKTKTAKVPSAIKPKGAKPIKTNKKTKNQKRQPSTTKKGRKSRGKISKNKKTKTKAARKRGRKRQPSKSSKKAKKRKGQSRSNVKKRKSKSSSAKKQSKSRKRSGNRKGKKAPKHAKTSKQTKAKKGRSAAKGKKSRPSKKYKSSKRSKVANKRKTNKRKSNKRKSNKHLMKKVKKINSNNKSNVKANTKKSIKSTNGRQKLNLKAIIVSANYTNDKGTVRRGKVATVITQKKSTNGKVKVNAAKPKHYRKNYHRVKTHSARLPSRSYKKYRLKDVKLSDYNYVNY